MTPELIRACELIFQEHKNSADPIIWRNDVFRGRISMGLCDMAKDTLVRKNVISFTNKVKKQNTVLNPAVVAARNFVEAIEMAATKKITSLVPVNENYNNSDTATPVAASVPTAASTAESTPVRKAPAYVYRTAHLSNLQAHTTSVTLKWYLKPVYYYVLWPLCAAALGACIAWALGVVAMSL